MKETGGARRERCEQNKLLKRDVCMAPVSAMCHPFPSIAYFCTY
uniref:Uncharacterized protein n=1 Tax=Ascaris lumbricoides TaxID=6252 RepID=A0A0M3HWB8_ASCLU